MARSVEELEHDEVAGSVVTVTEEARKVVVEAMAGEPDTENLALWLEVRGVQGANFAYDLYFQARRDEEASPGVPAGVLAAGIAGEAAQHVVTVLDQVINPSIASHGGRADLVAFDAAEGVAYLRLSGGCQGCAMSRMTLTQGIEVALRDEVPQITRVVDVTDHTGGENPYY